MESASSHFFSITELVNHLGMFLNHKEIARMMQTSRKLNELYTPALYYDVRAVYKYKKRQIFSSKDSIAAFARNTHHVRQLALNIHEVAYYANCIIAYQDQVLCQAATNTTTNDHPPLQHFFQAQRPLWLAPPDPHDCEVFPIPPMTLLTKLVIHAGFTAYIKRFPYLLPSFKDPKATLTHICWIMDLNPNLLDVSLYEVNIKDLRDLRLLTTSIYQLKNLQTLCLGFDHKYDWDIPSDLLSLLLFSYPVSLQSLNLSLVMEDFHREDPVSDEYILTAQGELQTWERDEVECGIPATTPRRQEPLLNLTSLSISDSRDDNGLSANDLALILVYCPNLTEIGLPWISEIEDVDRFAREVGKLCPNLSSVQTMDIRGNVAQKLAVRLLETLPQQQVKVFSSVSYRSFNDPDLADLRWHFGRHSSTLCSIELTGYQNFDSKIIQVILVQCVALEDFIVAWKDLDTRQQLCIDLEDAIEFPWGCTRIQEMKLAVAIPDEPLHHFTRDTAPYYNRPTPITLSTAEIEQFKSLEVFYRQIGSLTKLQTLKLRAIFYDPQGRRPISKSPYNAFPGMLSLGCEETGRPGFLHHLARLAKLQRLFGSVSADSKENNATIGTSEVEWMKQHWPMLVGHSIMQT